MRIFEIVTILLLAATVVAGAFVKERIYSGLLVLTAVAATLHAGVEGVRWQMGPAYLTLVILLLRAALSARSHRVPRHGLGIAAGCGTLGALALIVLMPVYALPAPSGPNPVGVLSRDLDQDPGPLAGGSPSLHRGPIAAQIWYPAQPGHQRLARYSFGTSSSVLHNLASIRRLVTTHAYRDAPVSDTERAYTVVLYLSSWAGTRTENTVLAEDLASHGYIVIAIDDLYPQIPLDFSSAEAFAQLIPWTKEKADNLARNVSAVLDGLEASFSGTPLIDRLDLSRIGVIGYSFGGAAAAAALDRDQRVKAAIDLDGWLFADPPNGVPANDQSFLVVTGQIDCPLLSAIPGSATENYRAQIDRASDARLFSLFQRHGGAAVITAGARHENFSDSPLYSPLANLMPMRRADTIRIAATTRKYVIAFFDAHLRGDWRQDLKQPGAGDAGTFLQIWSSEAKEPPCPPSL